MWLPLTKEDGSGIIVNLSNVCAITSTNGRATFLYAGGLTETVQETTAQLLTLIKERQYV